VNEIARMISGDKITEDALKFARGLMEEKCV
jgi:DNA repair ATPase RecN